MSVVEKIRQLEQEMQNEAELKKAEIARTEAVSTQEKELIKKVIKEFVLVKFQEIDRATFTDPELKHSVNYDESLERATLAWGDNVSSYKYIEARLGHSHGNTLDIHGEEWFEIKISEIDNGDKINETIAKAFLNPYVSQKSSGSSASTRQEHDGPN